MHDAIGLVEVLGAAGEDVMLGLLVRVEAADVGAVRVAQVRVAVGHPLGNDLSDAGAFLDPHCCGAPQVAHLGGLTEHRVGVGGQAQQAVDRVADLGLAEHVHQVDGLFELLVEIVGSERQLGRRQRRLLVGGDVVGVHEDRSVGVRADLHRAGGLALVAERVHVANDRVGDLLAALLQDVDRADIGHLMDRGREGDVGAGHRGDARAPHAAGDRDVLGLDAALVGHDRRHLRPAGPSSVSMSSTSVLANTCSAPLSTASLRICVPVSSESTHDTLGCVETAEQDLFVDERDELFDLGRRHQTARRCPTPWPTSCAA